MVIAQQIRVLALKNIWLAKRDKATTITKVVTPFLCMVISYLLVAPFWTSQTPSANAIPGIPKSEAPCATLMFYPNTTQIISLMQLVARSNDPPLHFGTDVVPTHIGDPTTFRNYMFNQNLTTQGGYIFDNAEMFSSTAINISYTIVYNKTNGVDIRLNLQTAIDNAIVKYAAGGSMKVSIRDFPTFNDGSSISPQTMLQSTAQIPLYMALAFLFFPVINAVIYDKEKNIHKYMKCFGLKDSAYWISWFTTYLVQHTAIAIILLAIGYAVPGLRIFDNCNFFVHFFNFMAFGVGLAGLLCFLSIFLSGTIGANTVGGIIFMFGLGASITTAMIGQYMYYWWGVKNAFVQMLLFLSYLTPTFHFLLVNVAIVSKAVGYNSLAGVSVPPTRFTLGDLRVQPYTLVPTPLFSIVAMLTLGVIYFALAIILDHFVFDLQNPLIPRVQNLLTSKNATNKELLNLNAEVPMALSVVNLSKSFGKGKRALQSINLHATEGSILVLLGPNGAGKTTLLNILSGLSASTGGTAFINGHCVQTDMNKIRSTLGVCLQNDVYWPTLTAKEHLRFFCSLSGAVNNVEQEIESKLNEVQLAKVGDKEVSTYSGGMRRRLSLAISMIGDPSVVLLDEPTTGIDVINQKYVWNIINGRKGKAKLIVIVTHSHEEAMRSGDKVVVLVDGVIRNEGTPFEIKKQLGDFHSLNVLVDVSKSTEIKSNIARISPDATVVAENAGSIVYSIPKAEDRLHSRNQLLNYLQKDQNIKDWKYSTYSTNFLIKND